MIESNDLLEPEHLVKNPLWLRAMLYVGVALFPIAGIIAGLSLWMSGEKDPVNLAVMGVFLLGALWLTYYGCLLFPHISTEARFNDDGIELTSRKGTRFVPWREIAQAQFKDVLQILFLRDDHKKIIYAVDFWTPGYQQFAASVRERVEDR